MLVGWLDDGGTPLLGPADRDVQGGKVLVMVRTPVEIAPQKAGARVSIPAVMMKLDTGRLPYERDRGESVATPQPGQWLIGFAAPAEVGRLRPTRATLRLRITLPGHRFAVYKGQCADGTPKANQFSEPLVAWERDVGAREVSMNLEPRDVDADGRVWLLVDVSPIGASAEPLSWQVKDIELTMDAEITGPAAPIALGPATTKPTESRDDWEAK